ncbi:hypothetical protein V2J09_011291 [Rumex salicifolius]
MSTMGNDEPSTAPPPDRWFPLTLGSSFKDHPNPSSKFCTLRYEFKPASIDKTQPGTLHKNKENRVAVEFHNNQPGKPKVTFEGSKEDYKENDAVLFFDGREFRLERLHRSFKRLRHIRLPGESNSVAAAAAVAASSSAVSVADMSSPHVAKGAAKVTNLAKTTFNPVPVEVERIDIGTSGNSASYKHDVDKPVEVPRPNPIPSFEVDDLEEELDILDNDDEDITEAELFNNTTIDINNTPHQADIDIEIADVDVNEDDADVGRNAAEALRAQVNAERESSSSGSSGTDSSGSGSGSGSTSSSDSESSDGNTVESI